MRKTKETVVTYTKTHEYCIVCDICHKEFEVYQNDSSYSNFLDTFDREESININKTSVRHVKGYTCPDGGNEAGIQYDVCPDCFETKLKPFLDSLGAVPTNIEIDW